MNLLYFNFKNPSGVIYINNISLREFLVYIGLTKKVHLHSFYGYGENKQFNETSLPARLSLNDLLLFIKDNRIIRINNIGLNLDGFKLEITDCFQYNLEGIEINEGCLRKMVLHFTGFSIPFDKDFHALEDQYIVIDKGKVVEFFETFEEYLESDYP